MCHSLVVTDSVSLNIDVSSLAFALLLVLDLRLFCIGFHRELLLLVDVLDSFSFSLILDIISSSTAICVC